MCGFETGWCSKLASWEDTRVRFGPLRQVACHLSVDGRNADAAAGSRLRDRPIQISVRVPGWRESNLARRAAKPNCSAQFNGPTVSSSERPWILSDQQLFDSVLSLSADPQAVATFAKQGKLGAKR